MKRLILFFVLFAGWALCAMEPDVPIAITHSDSCIVDIEALVGNQVAISDASTSRQLDFMTVKDGQLLVDTAKIPAAVAEFERTTRWEQMSPRTRTLVKVTLLGLTAIAASCTGYLTGYNFITVLFGYITGEAAANVMRVYSPMMGFWSGMVVFWLDSIIEVFMLGIHYYYGFMGMAVTIFMVRKIFDWLSSLTGRWTCDSAIYSKFSRAVRNELRHDAVALCEEIERARNGQPHINPAAMASLAELNQQWV